MWAALGKAAVGAVKGKAKKIATDKLLNRKKTTDARRASAKKVMGGGEEEGGAIVKAKMAPMPLANSTEAIAKTPAAGGGEGGSEQIQGTLLKIKTSVIAVDTLLKGSYTLQQKQIEQQRKSEEKAEDAAAEEDLEKGKKKGGPNIGKLVPKQVKSLWAKLLDFFTGIVLGFVAVRMVDFLPALMKAVPIIAGAIDWIAKIAVFAVNVLSTFVDGAYKFVGFMEGMVKGAFGEEGAKKFGIFMENLKNLFQGFLIWKLVGEKIFKALVNNIKNVWKVVTGVVRKAWVTIRRMMGRTLRKFFKNLAKRGAQIGKNVLKGAGNIAKNVGGKILGAGKGLLSKVGGGAVGKVGGLASKFLGPAAKTLGPVMKTVGPKIAKFAGRVPILGPLIVGVVSIMSGEPPGQAIFKALGAALGGALGTFIPIPVVGTLIGETIGVFVGDLIYELILGGGIEAVGKKLKDTFKTFIEPIFNFFKDGFTRLIEDFPTIPIPDIRPASIFAGIIEKVPGGEKLLNFTIPKWVPLIGGMGIGGILEGLPGLQEVLGFFAKFIPGLGNYVEGGKLTKIPNLFLLTPPGAPFLVPHIASSFLPGIFPSAGGDPPQPAVESALPMKSAKAAKEEEKEKKKAEAKEKRDEIKAKIGDVAGKVGGFFKNIGKGIKDIGGKIVEKHPAVMASKAVKSAIVDKKKKSQLPGVSSKPKSSFSNVAAGVDKAKNSAGIGQLEQFAFYEDPEGGGLIIREVPILLGGGAGAPAAESAPADSGGGKSASPFMALYRGDG